MSTKNGKIVNMDDVQIYPETIAEQVGFDPSTIALSLRDVVPRNVQGALAYALDSTEVASKAYDRANSAYDLANNAVDVEAYNKANSAYSRADEAYTLASDAYCKANSAYDLANDAYSTVNSAYDVANKAYDLCNIAKSVTGQRDNGNNNDDGTYILKATVTNGNVSISWVKEQN